MDFNSPSAKRWLGSNFEKGKRNYESEEKRAKTDILKKYPFARIEQFEFWVNINSKGDLSDPTTTMFVSDGATKLYNIGGTYWKYSWDITSSVFLHKYSSAVFFGPTVIWNPKGKQQGFERTKPSLPFDLFKFDAFVFRTKWVNKEKSKDITKVKFDVNDPYFNTLACAYLLSTVCGVCKDQLRPHSERRFEVSPIITSIMHYFFYYHMARFMHDPSKLESYLGESEYRYIQKQIPIKKIWTQKSIPGSKEIPSHWLKRQPNKHNIRNIGYLGFAKYGGSTGIKYEEVTMIMHKSDNDWMSFIQEKSEGFTEKVALLLQEAVESYVYSVLGAQARTCFKIVGAGAKNT